VTDRIAVFFGSLNFKHVYDIGRYKFLLALLCKLSSLVFWCYQQVYNILNMSCLVVILQVRGRDGMYTSQNGAAT